MPTTRKIVQQAQTSKIAAKLRYRIEVLGYKVGGFGRKPDGLKYKFASEANLLSVHIAIFEGLRYKVAKLLSSNPAISIGINVPYEPADVWAIVAWPRSQQCLRRHIDPLSVSFLFVTWRAYDCAHEAMSRRQNAQPLSVDLVYPHNQVNQNIVDYPVTEQSTQPFSTSSSHMSNT